MRITRRMTLAAFVASPFSMATTAAQSAPGGDGQTMLEKTYLQWLSVMNELDDNTTPPPGMTARDYEDQVISPIWDRADALAEKILTAKVSSTRDLAVKVLTALRAECGEMDGRDSKTYVGRVQAQALRLVNLSDRA